MKDNSNKIGRRDMLKSLGTIPVLGAFAYGWYQKRKYDRLLLDSKQKEINIEAENPVSYRNIKNNKVIRLGIIGSGSRGLYLLKAAGFVQPSTIDEWIKSGESNPKDRRYEEFLEQEDLNIVLNGVCDIFEVNAGKGLMAGANLRRQATNVEMSEKPKLYKTYQELIAADDIDAVIIATPDHWHGIITIDAANAGKHVYVEKPLTWTVPETYEVRKVVKESGIVFQLGHQNRQTESHFKAKKAYEQGVLGKVNLIEVTTNRNTPNGAWVYPIDEKANEQNIDWEQFIGPAPWHDFSLERFFRWRCWWDYSTGLSGDLFTHEYDAMNQIMGLGIPQSAMSSGGIYYYKDGRTVPDVLQQVFEYPDKDLTLMYSATLASNKNRGKVIMGHDAYMEIGSDLQIYADADSTKYANKIKDGIIDPKTPIYSFTPGRNNGAQVDAVSSPTEAYFAERGLLYTYSKGKRVDTTHLHIKDWLNCIRDGGVPACNIDVGFEEAITAHMGTISYHEKRKVFWDAEKEKII